MPLTWKDYYASAKCFGVTGALKICASRRLIAPWLPAKTFLLRPDDSEHSIAIRHGTSDKYVAIEVLAHAQYAPLLALRNVRVIVDAGANIGTASVFFLNAFPDCRLVSLEPDPGNFVCLQANLAPYAERVQTLQLALWGVDAPLVVTRSGFRDGAEWSFQVQPADRDGMSDVEGTTIASLANDFGLDTIDILKIDIEGAEREVFATIDPAVLQRVRMIAIELHDAEARQIFERSIGPFGSPTKQIGEVTYWHNPLFAD